MSRPPRSSGQSVARVFLFAFIIYAYFMPRWADWNTDSRLDLVHAIVDYHSLSIDRFHWNTWDKAVVWDPKHHRYHYYSDKAPGTAILGAVVYAGYVAVRGAPLLGEGIRAVQQSNAWNVAIAVGKTNTQAAPAAKGINLGGCQRSGVAGNVQYIPWSNRLVPPMRDWALSKYVVTVGVNGFLSSVFVAFFFWFLSFFVVSLWKRALVTGLYAFGTIAFPYSTVFYSHQLVAGFLFTAFGLLYLRRLGHVGRWSAPLAGFLLGMSLFTEYTVAIVVFALGLYGLWRLRSYWRESLLFVMTGVVPVLGLLAYNYATFGSPLDTGYSHDFCWSAAQAGGFAGFTSPQSGPLFDLTFGAYRGLFYLSPFLLFAVPGAYCMVRRGIRLEAVLCLGVSVVFILVISAYWGWNGGRVEGPRYLVPVLPFLAFPVAFFVQRVGTSRALWTLVLASGLWSLCAVWIQFLGGQLFPISWLRDPIFEYSIPALQMNQVAPNAGLFLGLNGWESLLPLLIILTIVVRWPPSVGKKRVKVKRAASRAL